MSNYASVLASAFGIGFSGLLFVVFLVLKLTHVINWSWVWIFCPLWGSALITLLFIVIVYKITKWLLNR